MGFIERGLMDGASLILLLICSACGVGAWYLRTFTQRAEMLRFLAGVGSVSMLLLIWRMW